MTEKVACPTCGKLISRMRPGSHYKRHEDMRESIQRWMGEKG